MFWEFMLHLLNNTVLIAWLANVYKFANNFSFRPSSLFYMNQAITAYFFKIIEVWGKHYIRPEYFTLNTNLRNPFNVEKQRTIIVNFKKPGITDKIAHIILSIKNLTLFHEWTEA